MKSKIAGIMRGSRGGGGGGLDPPGKPQIKAIGFLSNTGPDPLENQSYQASIQCWAIISPLAKPHFNGDLLVGQ